MDRSYENIEILTHCDPARALRVCLLALSVPGTMPVICAVNGEMDEILRRLAGIEIPPNLRFFPMRRRSIYPSNALRNAALAQATAEWVFFIDCDFVFCRDYWPQLFAKYGSILDAPEPVCLCPVALQDSNGAYLSPGQENPGRVKPAEICQTETLETHAPPQTWEEAGKAVLFKFHDRYFTEPFGPGCEPYDMTHRMRRLRHTVPAEPWGLIRRRDMAWADEDFVGGSLDKQQLVSAILDRGVRFLATPDLFIFHLWHPESTDARSDRVRNRSLWVKRHASASFHYLVLGGDSAFPRRLAQSLTQSLDSLAHTKPATSEAHDGVDDCLQAMKRGTRVVLGPPALSRKFLGYDYKVCMFFDSPAVYRTQGLAADGDYVYHLTHTRDLKEATSRLDNVAAVCDAGNVEASAATLRNVTGWALPGYSKASDSSPLEAPMLEASAAHERADRQRNPIDYFFYDYLRALAGTC